MVKLRNVAFTLLGINILIFFLQMFLGDWFTMQFLLNTSTIVSQPWTLITSMFLHSGPAHLLFNMYALFLFGPLVEQKIGSKRFLYMYFLAGILAGLGFMLFQNFIVGIPALALGASGAIMGVLGVTIMLFPDLKVLFLFFIPMSLRTAGILFAIVDVFGLFYNTGIANMAHLVGLAVGLLYGWDVIKKRKQFNRNFTKKKIVTSSSDDGITLTSEDMQEYLKHGRL